MNNDHDDAPDSQASRHPDWVRARMPGVGDFAQTRSVVERHHLATVCQEAKCPNLSECFAHSTATFMILGSRCTRRCAFCGVAKATVHGIAPDSSEPERLAQAVLELGLKYVVLTSVTRDDLPDGGAGHFARCAEAIKAAKPQVGIEVLIPDFGGDGRLLAQVVDSPIDVLNHNLETVPRLYARIRPKAGYWRSLVLLERAAQMRKGLRTKCGLMLGLGETQDEVLDVLCDLREAGCSILTLGQYLQPTKAQVAVARYLPPQEFAEWKTCGLRLGFDYVEAGPLVRSSYHAWRHVEGLGGAAGGD